MCVIYSTQSQACWGLMHLVRAQPHPSMAWIQETTASWSMLSKAFKIHAHIQYDSINDYTVWDGRINFAYICWHCWHFILLSCYCNVHDIMSWTEVDEYLLVEQVYQSIYDSIRAETSLYLPQEGFTDSAFKIQNINYQSFPYLQSPEWPCIISKRAYSIHVPKRSLFFNGIQRYII